MLLYNQVKGNKIKTKREGENKMKEIIKTAGKEVRITKTTLQNLMESELSIGHSVDIGKYRYFCDYDETTTNTFVKRIETKYLDTTGFYDKWNWQTVGVIKHI